MIGNLNGWYASLASQGLFLSDVILNERLPEGPSSVDPAQFNEVKSALLAFRTAVQDEESEASTEDVLALMEALFVAVLGHKANEFQAANSDGTNISAKFKASMPGKSLVPDFVLRRHGNTNRGRLLAKTLPPTVKLRGASRAGKVQRELILLLRHCRLEFGLLTNGHSLRLLRVTPEDVSWIQWDTATWEESEQGRSQFDAFSTLLGRDEVGQQPLDASKAETTDGPDRYVLQDACSQSRQRQSSLSSVVGEGVRQSVELLVNRLNEAAISSPELLEDILGDAVPRSDEERSALSSLHQAAVRLVMRMIVIMFAEARDLLPHRSSQVYRNNYSLTRLLEQLEDTESSLGQEALTTSLQAWPRILGLFDLVHDGSHHESLSIHAYGGELFRPGVGDSDDAVLRSLHAFEHEKATLDDARVLSILRKLKRSKMKANINGKSTWVATTVDYTTMDTEFIGMVYEGLLDYELRKVHEDDGAMVTLRIGQQPMLPISLLESQDDAQLKSLIETLDKKKDAGAPDLEEDTRATDNSSEEDEPTEDEVAENAHDTARERAEVWALRAVKASGKVKKPKGKKAQFVDMKELAIEAARNLLLSIHAPGDMYLINYSGNRKGSGTFYTPPGLSIPTVRRTLEPLCYDIVEEESEEGLVRTLTPKTPEHILAQTVCDPAMGSGSFLVAALRYLTDALFTSLEYHGNFAQMKKGTRITLPAGTVSKAAATEDLALHPDDARFEVECKARLKRYVAQRCIYGVDLNPMAVELGKMSLWVETLSRDLPFEFLDHHIKCGNSLVGAWFDEFEHFPIAAFARDAGDSGKKHAAPVHHQPNTWRDLMRSHFNALKDTKSTFSVAAMINTSDGQRSLFNFKENDPYAERRKTLAERRKGFQSIQDMPLHDPMIREQKYRILQSKEEFTELKLMMDTWCSCWYWPPNKLNFAPTPASFDNIVKGKTRRIVKLIAKEQNFFHWELEFPEIFSGPDSGFSATIGNPPWDTVKPYSKEWFSRFDPLYRTHSNADAKKIQANLFAVNPEVEKSWVSYQDSVTCLSHFIRNRMWPFGNDSIKLGSGKSDELLKEKWEKIRSKSTSFSSTPHPFRYQGTGDVNLYKAFVELFHHLRKPGDSRTGIIAPWTMLSDTGSAELRKLLLEDSSSDLLFGFENRKNIFQIHSAFKFGIFVTQAHEETAIKTNVAFMKTELSDLDSIEENTQVLDLGFIRDFDPDGLVIPEVQTAVELDVLKKMISAPYRLGGGSPWFGKARYQAEFHMSGDKDEFIFFNNIPADQTITNGFDEVMCLIEGRMVGEYTTNALWWISSHGRSAVWKAPTDVERYQPQYGLNRASVIRKLGRVPGRRIVFKDVTSATNSRTFIGSLMEGHGCGHSAPVIHLSKDTSESYSTLLAFLNSFVVDSFYRQIVGGNHLTKTHLWKTPLPVISDRQVNLISEVAEHLTQSNLTFGPDSVVQMSTRVERNKMKGYLDALVAESYNLTIAEFGYLLRDCAIQLDPKFKHDPKGFSRVDDDLQPESRRSVFAMAYFLDLENSPKRTFYDISDEYINEAIDVINSVGV